MLWGFYRGAILKRWVFAWIWAERDMRDSVLVEIGPVTKITINRPRVMNSIDSTCAKAIVDALGAAERNTEVRVIIITGAGDTAFCAGADMKEMMRIRKMEGVRRAAQFSISDVISKFISKPIIAAVNGLALGGGFEICLYCDLIVAARTARFGLPEVSHGLIAGGGGAVRLPLAMPRKMAMQMLLTGQPMDAIEADRWGLINRLTTPNGLMPATMELAEQIVANAPLAVAATKRVAHRIDDAHLSLDEAGAWSLSRAAQQSLLGTRDRAEGISAFCERRIAQWSGT